jgi:plastocyanin domain-containing protein
MLLFALSSFTCLAADPPFIVPIDKNGVQRVEVVASDYNFTPNHIVVMVNVPVEMSVRKDTLIVPHDFVIKAPEAGINISESLDRDPKTFFFTPTKPGKYQFYCDKKLLFMQSHREKGMEGILEVLEQ